MANQKLISIIVVTYNCGQKIENTLQSILSQNRDLFELIVIDGASTDDTLDYLRKYKDDLTLISEKDDGIYYAFNKGIDLTNGKYLYFIGAGDCLKPDILEQVKDFLPSAKPTLVYGKCYFKRQKYVNGKEFNAELFIRDNICHQGMFYHREIFDIVGKYDARYRLFADWFLNLKCFLHKEIDEQFIDYVIADYEEGGLSSRIKDDPVFKKDFPVFVKKKFGFFKSVVCRLFLTEPYIFNIIYYSDYHLFPAYFFSNYALPRYLISVLTPVVRKFRAVKKTVRNKLL